MTTLFLAGNPLDTFVLSEPLAATNLPDLVASLRNQNVSVFTYPLTIQLVAPQILAGAFQFAADGPPGVYTFLGSTNFVDWIELGVATNTLGFVRFSDPTPPLSPQKLCRAFLAP